MPTHPPAVTREMIISLSDALDPEHQSECWPDPVAWDGRSLAEQAADLVALADSRLRDLDLSDPDAKAIACAVNPLRKR